MASPPFNIDPTAPGDTSIVSQFPLNERTNRDNIKSWLQVDHNTNGQHVHVTLPQAAAPGAPGAGLSWLYAATDGTIRMASGAAGTEEILGIPPGVPIPWPVAGVLPNGFLYANGQAVSRTTFSRLFGLYGTTYGAGDGSTTFNVLDLRNRTIFGVDGAAMGGAPNSLRLTSPFVVPGATTYGATCGEQSTTIGQTNLPNYNLSLAGLTWSGSASSSFSGNSISALQSAAVSLFTGTADTVGGPNFVKTNTGSVADSTISITGSVTTSVSGSVGGTLPSGGSGTALTNLPPGLLMAWIIKW